MQDTEIYPASDRVGFVGRATFPAQRRSPSSSNGCSRRPRAATCSAPTPSGCAACPSASCPRPTRNALTQAGLPHHVQRHPLPHDRGRQPHQRGDQRRAAPGDRRHRPMGRVGLRLGLRAPRTARPTATWMAACAVRPVRRRRARRPGQPFGPPPRAGKALINGMKVNDEGPRGQGISQSVDTKWSRPLAQLDGGDLAIAMGANSGRRARASRPRPCCSRTTSPATATRPGRRFDHRPQGHAGQAPCELVLHQS